jgi:hypothetical protein
MLSCQTPEGHVLEARGEEDINSECHCRRTGLAQFQLRRVFVDTAQPHETDLEQIDHCGSIVAVRME